MKKLLRPKYLKEVGVNVRRSCEIPLSQHREEQEFRQGVKHGDVYGDGFRPSPEGEGFERHSGHVVLGVDLLEGFVWSELNSR
jgi:hypothetical protein